MDPLTHLALTRLLVGRETGMLAAGVLPDAPFYLLYPAWVLRQGELRSALRTGDWPQAPAWMQRPHHIAHSLPVILIAAGACRWCSGQWPRWAMAWALHILVDIPTHSRQHWAPQFLWPLSDITVDGVSWVELLLRTVRGWSSNG
jgi:hypothetical protein